MSFMRREKLLNDRRSEFRIMKTKLASIVIGVTIGSVFGMAHVRAAEAQIPWYEQLKPEAQVITYEIVSEPEPDTDEVVLPYATYRMLAGLVEAEAGNQDECGKRLVVDTVLNRVNDPKFPDTIVDVIYQPYQFSVVGNGQLQKYIDGRLEIPEENYRIVAEELIDQADYDVVFFQSSGWSPYGQHAYKYGDHYFSRW